MKDDVFLRLKIRSGNTKVKQIWKILVFNIITIIIINILFIKLKSHSFRIRNLNLNKL